MWFCPIDGTLLQIQQDLNDGGGGTFSMSTMAGQGYFVCSTCSYCSAIEQKVSTKTHLQRKTVDDVLGGAQAWENVDRTQATCPSCDHKEAVSLVSSQSKCFCH